MDKLLSDQKFAAGLLDEALSRAYSAQKNAADTQAYNTWSDAIVAMERAATVLSKVSGGSTL